MLTFIHIFNIIVQVFLEDPLCDHGFYTGKLKSQYCILGNMIHQGGAVSILLHVDETRLISILYNVVISYFFWDFSKIILWLKF